MSDQKTTATAREVRLMVALEVARDEMPEPACLRIVGEHHFLYLETNGYADAASWAAWLGVADGARVKEYREYGARTVSYVRQNGPGGWRWEVTGRESLPTPELSTLAGEVTSAITGVELLKIGHDAIGDTR